MGSKFAWVESNDEFEGVGAHPKNPRYNHQDAIKEQKAYVPEAERTDEEK